MLKIDNLRAFRPAVFGLVLASAMLAGCGAASTDGEEGGLLDPQTIAAQLAPEAQAVVTSYEADLRGAVSAHVAEFGQFPTSLADLPTLADARTASVNTLAQAIGEEIPFASEATAQQAADSIVGSAEGHILEQMSANNAAN